MTILVISEPNDVHAQSVMKALPKFTTDAIVLLNFQDFPIRMYLDQHLPSQGADRFAITLDNGKRLPIDEVRSVWWRRPQGYGVPVQGMEPHARQFALSETATAFQGMWQCTECLWINDIIRDAAASHKPWQLHLAKQAGLRIPDTVITNNPTQARSFWDHCQGEVIYKPFIQTFHSWRETRKLRRSELSMPDCVKWAPVIFQRLIPGVADLRVTIIGNQVFPAAVDLRKVDYQLDVRLNQQAYEKHALPQEVQNKLLVLMRRLGLEYGAIDLRLTPDGEYVFFEVNPAGQFLFVELACQLPISESLARHLAVGVNSKNKPVPIDTLAKVVAA